MNLSYNVSDYNSTLEALPGSGTFLGRAEDVSMYGSVVVSVITDKQGILTFEFSSDDKNWDTAESYAILANTESYRRSQIRRKFFRVRFKNEDQNAQLFLRLQSTFGYHGELSGDPNAGGGGATLLGVAKGDVAGDAIVIVEGKNANISTGSVPEDLWLVGGVYTGFPMTAETVTVVSGSASDTLAGTGARTVTLEGLDGNYVEIIETVEMNGTSNAVTTNSFLRINKIYVSTAGSNRTNVGTIIVAQSITTTNIFGTIQAGNSRAFYMAYTTPANKTAILTQASIAAFGPGLSVIAEGMFYTISSDNLFQYHKPILVEQKDRYNMTYYGAGLYLEARMALAFRVTTISTNNSLAYGEMTLVTTEIV